MATSVALERPKSEELAELFRVVGWGKDEPHILARSVAAYPCTICARNESGELVGYLSAFSDEVMTTMLGELLVHPRHRRQGVATALIHVLEKRFPLAPIYIKALGDSKLFYQELGFKVPKAEFTVMFKRPSVHETSEPEQSLAAGALRSGA